MVIDDSPEYDKIWDWVHKTLHFQPNGLDKGHDFPYGPPFQIPFPHTVYGIENMTEPQLDIMDDLIRTVFLNVTQPGQRLYALDWQHSGFLFDPRADDAYQSVRLGDSPYFSGGLYAYFPPFYPDGDYYFFIDEHLQFGYLSHPWREEVWIFGDVLIAEFEKIYRQLGWYQLHFPESPSMTLNRIRQMELYFDTLQTAASENPAALREDASLQSMLHHLTRYYESGEWLRDYELDGQGLLPPGLKRGVLAQDAVYDLLEIIQSHM